MALFGSWWGINPKTSPKFKRYLVETVQRFSIAGTFEWGREHDHLPGAIPTSHLFKFDHLRTPTGAVGIRIKQIELILKNMSFFGLLNFSFGTSISHSRHSYPHWHGWGPIGIRMASSRALKPGSCWNARDWIPKPSSRFSSWRMEGGWADGPKVLHQFQDTQRRNLLSNHDIP